MSFPKMNIKPIFLAAAMTALLAACGGGSDEEGQNPQSPGKPSARAKDPVEMARVMGGHQLPEHTYEVGMQGTMGDWNIYNYRIRFNNHNGTYQWEPMDEKSPPVSGTFTMTETDNLIKYRLDKGFLSYDKRTKTITGNPMLRLTLGSSYSASNATMGGLQGKYSFVKVGNGGSLFITGDAIVEGNSVKICKKGLFVDGKCTAGENKIDTYAVTGNQVYVHYNPLSGLNNLTDDHHAVFHMLPSDLGRAFMISGETGHLYFVEPTMLDKSLISKSIMECIRDGRQDRLLKLDYPNFWVSGYDGGDPEEHFRTTVGTTTGRFEYNSVPGTAWHAGGHRPGYISASGAYDSFPISLMAVSSSIMVGQVGSLIRDMEMFSWCFRAD